MHKCLQQSSFCIFSKIQVSLNFCSIRLISIQTTIKYIIAFIYTVSLADLHKLYTELSVLRRVQEPHNLYSHFLSVVRMKWRANVYPDIDLNCNTSSYLTSQLVRLPTPRHKYLFFIVMVESCEQIFRLRISIQSVPITNYPPPTLLPK